MVEVSSAQMAVQVMPIISFEATKSIELDPSNTEYYHSRGTTLHSMELHEDALLDRTKAIKLDSKNPLFYCEVPSPYTKWVVKTKYCRMESPKRRLSERVTIEYVIRKVSVI